MKDFLKHADEAAEAADSQTGGYSNFGRLELQLDAYKVWKTRPDDSRYAEEVEEDVWNQFADNDRFMEINFIVHIEELNPNLEWSYKRKVSILGKNSDWGKIVRPSINEVFGENATLTDIDGSWVEVKDVPQVRDKDYNTIKFVRQFGNMEACKAAWEELTGGVKETMQTSGSSSFQIPAVYGKEMWEGQILPVVMSGLEAGSTVEKLCADYGVQNNHIQQYIDAMKRDLANGETLPVVAEKYGVTVPYVAKLANG